MKVRINKKELDRQILVTMQNCLAEQKPKKLILPSGCIVTFKPSTK